MPQRALELDPDCRNHWNAPPQKINFFFKKLEKKGSGLSERALAQDADCRNHWQCPLYQRSVQEDAHNWPQVPQVRVDAAQIAAANVCIYISIQLMYTDTHTHTHTHTHTK